MLESRNGSVCEIEGAGGLGSRASGLRFSPAAACVADRSKIAELKGFAIRDLGFRV